MNKVIIHLGMIKTGSTWIQKNVFSNLINYHFIKYYDFDDYPMNTNLIISNEVYSGSIHWFITQKTDIYRYEVARRIHTMFPDAYIILVTREIKPWLKSVYNQYIKECGILKEQAFYDAVYPDWLNITDYKKFLNELFDHVLFLDFNDFKTNKHFFIKNICDFIHEPTISIYDDKRINKTLTGYQLESLRLMNKYLPCNRFICNMVKYVSSTWGSL